MPRFPSFQITYNGTDISKDISEFLLSITFNDKLEGEADDLNVEIENSDLRWLDTWLPDEGATVGLTLGYLSEQQLGPILFEIDEPTFQGAPDTASIKALSVPVTSTLRTQKARAFEGMTLRSIAAQIAQEHGLELVGEVPDLTYERITQTEVNDLEFLQELAEDHGLVFKVESGKLIFYSEEELENQPPAFSVDRRDISRYGLRRGAVGTYKEATIEYQDPESGEFISATIDIEGTVLDDGQEDDAEATEETTPTDAPANEFGAVEEYGTTQETLTIRRRVENLEQAQLIATEQLRRANRAKIELDIELEGDVRLAAGVNLGITGFKRFDGVYQAREVRHSLDKRSGYRCSVKLLRLRDG